jgi:hypothetical protein
MLSWIDGANNSQRLDISPQWTHCEVMVSMLASSEVMVSMLASSEVDIGSGLMTIRLVFVSSLLSMQHSGERAS